ncbi:glycosyltransferase [Cyanobium sp. Morenito 9A2]|nr:glycosyltransferase [Cyanobium sp. Morenito 9A2]
MAFPEGAGSNVCLLLKWHGELAPEQHQKLIDLRNNDERIIFHSQYFSPDQLFDLISSCHCYVSLHRSEGFGNSIAEAMLLGLDIIATNYSGNVDFCLQSSKCRPVSYELVSLSAADYPFSSGQCWAEPSLNSAAHEMIELYRSFHEGLRKEQHDVHALSNLLFASHVEAIRDSLSSVRYPRIAKQFLMCFGLL